LKWTEVKIITTEEASDAISEMLTSIGAGGVAVEDPNDIRREVANLESLDYIDEKLIKNLSDDIIIKAYFPGAINKLELKQLITEKLEFISRFLNVGKGFESFTEIDEEDWSTAWKKYYKPFNITEKIVIKPTWEDYSPKEEEIVIQMDPGMAFGTGTHETTQMCAQLLEKYIKQDDTVVDAGCGTGILSIIAAKLGAKSITAFDIDEVAVKVTNENSALNNASDKIKTYTGDIGSLYKYIDASGQKADIIIANIIANVIISISGKIAEHIRQGGYFITSGIINERADDVKKAYSDLGFKLEETLNMGEWTAMVFKCQSSL